MKSKRDGHVLFELAISITLISSFLLVYFNVKTNLSHSNKALEKEYDAIQTERFQLYKAMTAPLPEILLSDDYQFEQETSKDYKIFLKNSSVFSEQFVKRRD